MSRFTNKYMHFVYRFVNRFLPMVFAMNVYYLNYPHWPAAVYFTSFSITSCTQKFIFQSSVQILIIFLSKFHWCLDLNIWDTFWGILIFEKFLRILWELFFFFGIFRKFNFQKVDAILWKKWIIQFIFCAQLKHFRALIEGLSKAVPHCIL